MVLTFRILGLSTFLAASTASFAAVTHINFDVAAFTAAGGAGIAVDFDSVADGTPFEGVSLGGATFSGPGSPLQVVIGAETSTPGDAAGNNRLLPTSGRMVLSPGGKDLSFDPAVQNDIVDIVLASPSSSFGFDMLYQSDDFFTFADVALYDASNNLIEFYGLPAAPGAGGGGVPGGAEFYGFLSTVPISRIVIAEHDGDSTNPDANIGVDTLRFQAVPEPSAWAAMAVGALAVLRRRKKE